MTSMASFHVRPVCRLITRPRWFLLQWEEVKQSATHTEPFCGDNRLQTHLQMLGSEGSVKTNLCDTLPSFFCSNTLCQRANRSLVPRAAVITEKTNQEKPRGYKAWNLSILKKKKFIFMWKLVALYFCAAVSNKLPDVTWNGWINKEPPELLVRCIYIGLLYVKHTHTVHTNTRGKGDLIKYRQWLCGLAYSLARPQAATATVHLGQLDVTSKPKRPWSNGFTNDIVVCVVTNQQCPPLGCTVVEAAERVTWRQLVEQRPPRPLCDLRLMCMLLSHRPQRWNQCDV